MKTEFKEVNGAYNWWITLEDGTEMLLDDWFSQQPVTG